MTRKTYTAEYKTKLVLEVFREESRLEEIAAANEINPNMLRNWKHEFLKNASSVFSQNANTDANEPFARRIQTSETVDLNQGNGRLNQAKQHQAIQYNWIKPH